MRGEESGRGRDDGSDRGRERGKEEGDQGDMREGQGRAGKERARRERARKKEGQMKRARGKIGRLEHPVEPAARPRKVYNHYRDMNCGPRIEPVRRA
jgi:hypothetical protein